MKTSNHLLYLFLILIGSLAFHCSLYFFLNTSQYNFYDTDSWYTIRQIERFSHGEDIQFDNMLNYPEGRIINWGITLPIFYSFFVNRDDSTLVIFNKVGFLPPILAALFALLVYFLVSKLYSENSGFYSAILLSFGTGIYFQNCLFGIIDHHLLESILFTVMILCLLIAVKEKSDWWILSVMVCGIILFFTSILWIFFYGIVGICIILLFLLYMWKRNHMFGKLTFILTVVIIILFIWYFKDIYWFSLLWSWIDPISEISISNPTLLLLRFNILIPIFFFGVVYIIFSKKEFPILALLMISIILIVLTFRFTRMEYLLTPFLLILSSIFLDKFFTKRSAEISTVIISVFLIFSIIIGTVVISEFAKTADNNFEWNDALSYLQEQEPGLILSWWDYGHWIVTVSGQPPITDPFQANVIYAAKVFTDEIPTPGSPSYKYIIITKNDYKFYDAMLWYSKSPVSYERSYLKKLINGNENGLIFENTLIKIYQV